jgi:hypothetical protein
MGREPSGRFGAIDGEEQTFIDRATERCLRLVPVIRRREPDDPS